MNKENIPTRIVSSIVIIPRQTGQILRENHSISNVNIFALVLKINLIDI
jgi:hypothetical protein